MTTRRQTETVRALMKKAGRTYADDAGIMLKDTPAPLFQLLVLSLLISAPISADIAVSAARQLFSEGYRTPEKMADAEWQDLVDALGRGHYKRYDESTATRLREAGQKLIDDHHGDLRRLADDSGQDTKQAAKLLEGYTGIGPVGADVFLREVQDVWPWVAPYFDKKARSSAGDLGLPQEAEALGELAGDRPAEFAAALVRASLDDDLRAELE